MKYHLYRFVTSQKCKDLVCRIIFTIFPCSFDVRVNKDILKGWNDVHLGLKGEFQGKRTTHSHYRGMDFSLRFRFIDIRSFVIRRLLTIIYYTWVTDIEGLMIDVLFLLVDPI